MSETSFRRAIYVIGFVLGFVLMGFEMLSSRYLYPWFGSGINTWAALISVTLFALMVGYFLGGRLVDWRPSAALLGWLVLGAALWMALIALPVGGDDPNIDTVADLALLAVIDVFDVRAVGVTAGAFVLIFVPLTLISCYSPFAVRLLLVSTEASGRQTGSVYGINTFGNILGTWMTTFTLIPAMGTQVITLMFAAVTVVCAIALMRMRRA